MVKTDTCEYHCDNGVYFDRVQRKRIQCPVHAKKREEDVRTGYVEGNLNLSELLGFEGDYFETTLDVEQLLSKSQLGMLSKESIADLKDSVSKVNNNLLLGVSPDMSWCFGLDRTCRADKIAVPLLLSAYKAGLTLAPFISATDYRVRTVREEALNRVNDTTDNFRDLYINVDVVVMLIPSGVSEGDVLESKGLMQSRAAIGKSTIFITSRPYEVMTEIIATDGDEPTKFIARPAMVRYQGSDDVEVIAERRRSARNARVMGNAHSTTLDSLTAL